MLYQVPIHVFRRQRFDNQISGKHPGRSFHVRHNFRWRSHCIKKLYVIVDKRTGHCYVIHNHIQAPILKRINVGRKNIHPPFQQRKSDIREMADAYLCGRVVPIRDIIDQTVYYSTFLQKYTSSKGIFAILALVTSPKAFSIWIFCSSTATLFLDDTTVSGFTEIDVHPLRIMNSR